MHAIAVVFLYVFATLPFLVLLVRVLRHRSDYTRLFVGGLLLQLLPIGLLYLPLGLAGVLLLGFTLVSAYRRNRLFRSTGIEHPDVERRWSIEYQANLLAFGFALEQKAIAWLFVQVVSHQGFQVLWRWILPLSLPLWLGLVALLVLERRMLRARLPL